MGTAVAEARELQGDELEVAEIHGDAGRRLIALQAQAEAAIVAAQPLAPRLPLLQRHDDVAPWKIALGHRDVFGQWPPGLLGQLAVLRSEARRVGNECVSTCIS